MRLAAVALLVLAQPALAAGKFTLKSSDVKPGGTLTEKQVFNGFGCQGGNVSPQLAWSNPPAGTKSFVVTVYDPDAPTGSGWWHWVVFDIPADVHELPAGAGGGTGLPAGAVQGRTDFGAPGFGGACPPPGDKPHRYVFTVYALKVEKLDAPADTSAAMIGFMTHASQRGKASFTAKYGRKK
ncbi:MAG TPA: YbhB/YbcL family Raf kinase inhibitor-like protein [Anaeromyxobacter sp.]|nr:YbhB/YbcL family Raf kinase inhibitor-like protein [Anaeromyxobacter sp.]